MYTWIIAYRHDIKNQIDAVKQLIKEEGNVSRSAEYMQVIEESSALENVFMTGNVAVDSLLAVKNHHE